MVEQYKPIDGYPNYAVSNFGDVINVKFGRRLKQPLNGQGRPHVNLCRNGIPRTFRVHRLVAETFIGPRPEGLVTCHNDGNELNNNVANLRYDTQKNNVADAARMGNLLIGESSLLSKLTEEQVREIRHAYSFGFSQAEIARYYGISGPNIHSIVQRKTWRHI